MPENARLTPSQQIAVIKLKEYSYREKFHLSKRQMLQEPMEDFLFNNKITELLARKQNKESAIIEMKSANSGGSINKDGN